MKHYIKTFAFIISLGFVITPISHAQTGVLDKDIGLQNVDRVDAEFIKTCVNTEDIENGGKKANKILNMDKCDDSDENSPYYYRLYPDAPTFLGKEGDDALRGYFNIGDDKKVINGDLGKIYQSSLNNIKTYGESNIISDSNVLYYKLFVNDNNMRVVESESTHSVYVPLYKIQQQFIPSIGEYIDPIVTKNFIDDREVPNNVNINYVEDHSLIPPEDGIEAAINTKSENKDMVENEKDVNSQKVESTVAVTVTETHKEDPPKPKEPKEPLTLADFKWLIIGLGVLGAIALITFIIENIRRANKRRKEEKEKRRIAEQERQHKKNLWDDAIATIDKTMADYAQKDADIANKTLFYPLIDDITHPLHIEFLEKMKKVGEIKESPFSEARIDYVRGFAQDFSKTWNNLFSTAQEVGVPWIKKKEDKQRAQKLLSLVLDDSAYDGERESARENLIKLVNDLFEEDKEERTTKSRWTNTMHYNEDPIYDKYNIRPNNLRNSINKNLNKNVRELSQQQAIAIEAKK